jgi:hypothetical protein
MTFLISLLANKLAGPFAASLAAVLALALAGVWTVERVRIGALRKEVAQASAGLAAARADLGVCQAGAASLEGGLRRQNAAVQALASDGAARAKAAASAVDQARVEGRTETVAAGRALAARPGADLCASADHLILESVK